MDFEAIRRVTADLTDEQLWKTIKISRGYMARAVAALAREGWQPIPTAPAPAVEGEDAIAIKLQQLASQNPLGVADPTIARAVELLRQHGAASAPADEGSPTPDEHCLVRLDCVAPEDRKVGQ